MKMTKKVKVRLYNIVWEGTGAATLPKEIILDQLPKKGTVDEAAARLFGKKAKITAYDLEIVGVNKLRTNKVLEFGKGFVRGAAIAAVALILVKGYIGATKVVKAVDTAMENIYYTALTNYVEKMAPDADTVEGETVLPEETTLEEIETETETVTEAATLTEIRLIETETRVGETVPEEDITTWENVTTYEYEEVEDLW